MKIALCISGLVKRGKQGPNSYLIGYENFKNELINKYKNLDIFLYSCEPELENELVNLYKPIKKHIEIERDFSSLDANFPGVYAQYPVKGYHTVLNMLYGRYMVGKLKAEYEKQMNFEYDWVIYCRYDQGSADHIIRLFFDDKLDNTFIYTPAFLQINAGPQDQWFFCNTKDADYAI